MGILDDILSGLAFAGNVVDTPWGAIRTAVTERDVGAGLESIFDFDRRASGKAMLNSLFGEFEGDELAGLATEILPDMLLPGAGAYKLLSRFKGAKPAATLATAAPEGRGFLDAIDKAVPTPMSAGGLPEHEVLRIVGSNPILEAAEQMPLALPAPMPAAPPYYSRLRNAVEALPGENFKSQSVLNQLKRVAPEGFSQEELEWSQLGDLIGESPITSKAAMLDQVDQGMQRYKPTWNELDPLAEHIDDRPHYSQYSTGTGKYGETLAQVEADAMSGGEFYDTPHFPGQANPVLHLRTELIDRPGGGKTLLANELQSDWHQKGAKAGYVPVDAFKQFDAVRAQGEQLAAERGAIAQQRAKLRSALFEKEEQLIQEAIVSPEFNSLRFDPSEIRKHPEFAALQREAIDLERVYEELLAESEKLDKTYSNLYSQIAEGVPNAPFKKDWPLLGLKELIRQGVEKGADEVAWLPGERVQSMVGGVLKGQQQFYDKDLVNTANKYLKSRGWNTKVEAPPATGRAVRIRYDGTDVYVPEQIVKSNSQAAVADHIRTQLPVQGANADSLAEELLIKFKYGEISAKDFAERRAGNFKIKITPEMKRDLRERGQPLMNLAPFAVGGGGLAAALMADES